MNLHEQSIHEFLTNLASRAPTPGGGSASALIGAVGAALCGMVGRLNDKKSGEGGPLHETIERADALMQRLRDLAAQDIAAFEALMQTWKLPADDPTTAGRKTAAVVRATQIPLDIMAAALDVMKLTAEGLAKSKKNCVSDAAVAAIAAHACVEGARMNVLINLPGLSDERLREELAARGEAIRAEARGLRAELDEAIQERCG